MRKRTIAGTIIALVAAIALSGVTLATGTFTNGSFENGTYSDGGSGWDTLVGSTSVITGWSTSGTDYWVGTYWQAEQGAYSVELSGWSGGGTIQQTFATQPEATYVVQFYLAGNPDRASVKTLEVSAGTTPAQTYSFANDSTTTKQAMGYVLEAYSFMAPSDATTLTFSSVPDASDYGPYGPVIDNVTVTETESPGANCKDGGWTAMTDSSGNHFKNQGACVSYFAISGDTPIGS